MRRELPQNLQNEVLEMLDSDNERTFVKASKMKQARMLVKLRKKYNFSMNKLGLN